MVLTDGITGVLKGQVKWEAGLPSPFLRLRIESRGSGSYVQCATDEEGRYTAELPVGTYLIVPEAGRLADGPSAASVLRGAARSISTSS